ncbi:hypothetical protein SAMN05421853_10233 [Roseivivax halotolerans]|uniref:PH domain-containing protein n=1 Tax=Roseivivax halotolerans TaxID=93684 RepID=A0A1I5VYU5_9RHOB|nr:hypothetical protein [Roseivivax halotolerans]SFQ12708.1 hypothetical protein SAMN05421853_10233 [Roseivivax halotolerans]
MSDEILAEIRASQGRRWFGILSLAIVGAFSLYVAAASPPPLGWMIVLVVIGLGALWMAQAMHKATALRLELTRHELRDSTGRVLARLDDVVAVDRGMFAMKPSNGFVLKMTGRQARSWRPGLYWSLGRRVAVGGVTPASQTRPMADAISIMLAEREMG